MAKADSAHTTVWALTREWRSTFWKQRYEASLVAEDDDETLGRVVDAADKEMQRLERAIARTGIAELDEISSVIAIIKTLMAEGFEGQRITTLLDAIHAGVNTIRRVEHRQAA